MNSFLRIRVCADVSLHLKSYQSYFEDSPEFRARMSHFYSFWALSEFFSLKKGVLIIYSIIIRIYEKISQRLFEKSLLHAYYNVNRSIIIIDNKWISIIKWIQIIRKQYYRAIFFSMKIISLMNVSMKLFYEKDKCIKIWIDT